MADYIYLLENRLSPAQLRALSIIRNAVRERELTLFLTGGAVRDLTGGGSVRDLDVTVQGDVSALRGALEAQGAVLDGENRDAHALYFTFPGGVRVEVASAMSVSYPKPGKPKYETSSIIEDLRRRDFTANAMGLSLNEGSYGLLMDPLNGVADIENRELRLVSNYGFIEDPSLMLRAVRLSSRLGLQMEEKTRQRYDNAKADDAIAGLSKFSAAYELEEIFHEEDPLRTMRALDGEGWLKVLSPKLQGLKANESALADLRDKQGQLQTQGILSDAAALAFPLLMGKLAAPDVQAVKASFARPGFAREIDAVEDRTREFQAKFSGKDAGTPSVAWRMLHEAEPNLVLAMFFTAKGAAIQGRLKTFLTESPAARQRLPYAVMQEMRITPDLPVYAELLDKLFFELMDNKLGTTEELKAYLEPYSPPAPPPPVNLRRARAKKEARPSRAKSKKAAAETVAKQEEAVGVAEGILEPGTLTGSDRGPEPTVTEPLEGKVAPLAPGGPEPAAGKEKRSVKKPPAAQPAGPVLQPEVPAAAKKLSTKPTPMPKQEAAATAPHPLAAKQIAPKRPAVVPQKSIAPVKAAKAAKQPAGTKAAAKSVPAKAVGKASKQTVKAIAARQASAKPTAATKKSSVPAKKTTAVVKKAAKAPVSKKAATAKALKKSAPAKAVKKAVRPVGNKSAVRVPPAKAAKKATAKKSPAKVVTKATGKSAAKAAAKKASPAKKSSRR